MAGLLDFFSPEAGQRRTAALGGLVDRAEYYVPPELRSILGFAGEMSPVAGLQRAGQASERMLDPSRTGGQRFGDLGEMLSETAGVAAPMAVAGRAGVPVAKAIQEGLLGFSAGADDVGRRVLDRLNQPGPVPTMYSNPLGGAKPTLDQMRANARQRIADRAKMVQDLTQDDAPIRMKSGDLSVLVSRSPDREGWRATYFQPDGSPSGHVDAKDKTGAVQRALEDQFTPIAARSATSPAQEVAGLLSSGRADEVTDEMLAKFTPKDEMEIFDLYQRGATGMDLPMDEASRMQRAGDFTPALHGTGADITAVDPSFFGNGQDLLGTGFYTTTAPSRADRYVPRKKTPSIERSKEYAEGGNIMPLMVREQNPFMLDQPIGNAANEIADIYAEDPFFNVERMSSGVNIVRGADNNSVMLDPYQQRHWALQNMRKSYGPSDTSDVLSEAGYSGVSGPESSGNRVRLAYEPTDIRSRFARFDPRLSHLRNLSAGVGGMGLLGMSYPQEEQY